MKKEKDIKCKNDDDDEQSTINNDDISTIYYSIYKQTSIYYISNIHY